MKRNIYWFFIYIGLIVMGFVILSERAMAEGYYDQAFPQYTAPVVVQPIDPMFYMGAQMLMDSTRNNYDYDRRQQEFEHMQIMNEFQKLNRR